MGVDTGHARLGHRALRLVRRLLGRVLRLARPTPSAEERYRAEWNAEARRDALTAILRPTDGSTGAGDFDEKGRLDADWLRQFVTPESVVLDVGCGIGRIGKHLAPYCARICGVDVSDEMIQAARSWTSGISNLEFHRTSATDLSVFPDRTFDFAFSCLVLQHLEYEDAFRALREIARVLKPEGRAVLQFPSLAAAVHAAEFTRRADTGERHPARARLYTADFAARMLALAGLKVERIEPHPGGTLTQNEIVAITRLQPDRPVVSAFHIRPLTPEVTDATVRWLITATVSHANPGLLEGRAEVALVATGQTFGLGINGADLVREAFRGVFFLVNPPRGQNHAVFSVVDAGGERSNETPFLVGITGERRGATAGPIEGGFEAPAAPG